VSPLGSASPSAKEAGRGGEKALRLSGGERGLPLSLVRCDVSVRLYRKVHNDCTLSFEGSRYQVPHTLVGKRILIGSRRECCASSTGTGWWPPTRSLR